LIKAILGSERGSVAIQIGAAIVVIVGMVALGVEITFLLYKQRQMQSAADSAAFGGATALATGYPAVAVEARAIAASLGFANGSNGVGVVVNNPPASGPHAGDGNYVAVTISQPQTLSMVGLFVSPIFNVGARAVAAGNRDVFCVVGLDTSASNTVSIKNNGVVSSPTCGVVVNSNSDNALVLENNAAIYGPVSVVGKYSLANNAHLYDQTPPYPKQGANPSLDPYAGVSFSASGPPQTQPTGCTVCQLSRGVYAQGLNYTSTVTLNLAAGVYYIGTRLNLTNNVTVNATAGVTLVINGNFAMNVGNNLNISIVAPTSGATAGIAIASIRTASSSVTQLFANNAILNLTGALYFPNQILQFDNNSTINTPTCGQLIARKISIQNNANLKTICAGTGVTPVTAGGAQLVE
jgi:Flp pilus assembly protein TadG